MKTFTIENDTNYITIHASAHEAKAVINCECFATEEHLSSLAANWPASRSSSKFGRPLTGVTPVRKFKDRATAVSRVWKAIQTFSEALPSEPVELPEAELVGEAPQKAEGDTAEVEPIFEETADTPLEAEPAASPVAEATAPVAPQTPDVATEAAPAKTRATRAKKTPTAATARESGTAREGSKTSQVIAMLKREGGTTLEEIMTAMQWQKHTTRAMLSAGGSLTKNHGLNVVSEKVGEKRVYSIKG